MRSEIRSGLTIFVTGVAIFFAIVFMPGVVMGLAVLAIPPVIIRVLLGGIPKAWVWAVFLAFLAFDVAVLVGWLLDAYLVPDMRVIHGRLYQVIVMGLFVLVAGIGTLYARRSAAEKRSVGA